MIKMLNDLIFLLNTYKHNHEGKHKLTYTGDYELLEFCKKKLEDLKSLRDKTRNQKMFSITEVEKLYGDVELDFVSYYKYAFTYNQVLKEQNVTIEAVYGGDADSIYKYTVYANASVILGSIEQWSYVRITKNGAEIFLHHDW